MKMCRQGVNSDGPGGLVTLLLVSAPLSSLLVKSPVAKLNLRAGGFDGACPHHEAR